MNLSFAQYAALQGAKLYPKQIEALEAVSRGWPTSLVACNGAGKTAIVAAYAVQGFFARHPQGKLVATSGSFNQLKNQLWPALKTKMPADYEVLNGSSPCEIRNPLGGKGVGFSTKDPRRAEGWHPTIDRETDPVFILVDEGKAVPNEIFVAFDRCTVKYVLYISSPGPPHGRFYDTHHKLRKYFYTVQITSYDCPHISAAKRERDREILGEDSPEFRSMHLAEFTDLDNHCIISLGELRKAMDTQPLAQPTRGERVAFFDFAAGGDENVFALREGNTVKIVETWRDKDTVQAVRRFIRIAREHDLSSGQCWGDGDGLGLAMINQFKDEGYPINSFRGGMPAQDAEKYSNLISEVWAEGLRKVKRGQVHVGELDPSTIEQLTGRFLEWDSRGKIRAESKEDMRKRGISSPDRGDALLGALMCGSHMTGSLTSHKVDSSYIANSDYEIDAVEF